MANSTPNAFDLQVNSAGLTTSITAYTSGDQLGTELDFTSGGAASCYAVITSITIVDYAKVIGALDVRVFKAATTEAANNAAASWSDADMLNAVAGGLIPLAAPTIETNNSVTSVSGLFVGPFQCDGSGHFWVDLITRSANAVFAAADDLKVRIGGFYFS